MRSIAIIPARGGSKRIPRKNIRLFRGKPIIAYSIQTAIASGLFDTVMVSTDDEEIAAIAREYGAEVPFLRNASTANDRATLAEVLVEVLNTYRSRGEVFAYACCLLATAPFITTQQLQAAFSQLSSGDLKVVLPVLSFGFPIQRALRMNEKSLLQMFQSEHRDTRSQDLEPAYHDSGQFYLFSVEYFLEKQQLWTDRTGGILISDLEAHDIDTEEDWAVAEFKYAYLNRE